MIVKEDSDQCMHEIRGAPFDIRGGMEVFWKKKKLHSRGGSSRWKGGGAKLLTPWWGLHPCVGKFWISELIWPICCILFANVTLKISWSVSNKSDFFLNYGIGLYTPWPKKKSIRMKNYFIITINKVLFFIGEILSKIHRGILEKCRIL